MSRWACAVLIFAFGVTASNGAATADPFAAEASRVLPVTLDDFRQTSPVRIVDRQSQPQAAKSMGEGPTDSLSIYDASTEYTSPEGDRLAVTLSSFENAATAYSQFTLLRKRWHDRDGSAAVRAEWVGTTSTVTSAPGLIFFKGANVVTVSLSGSQSVGKAFSLGRLIAASINDDESEVPVLVKHLPNWAAAEPQVIYAVKQPDLKAAVGNQPIIDELGFQGGTEAVVANYGQSQLVIVEFTTPQFSVDNDSRIWTKIAELKSQGQPVPSAYRRIGNYSVFVFNAADEKGANALIDQVKYEQVVQWLGDDPHLADRLQRYFTQTSAGVLVAVLKSSGLSLVLCLAVGGLIGALLFRHRRAQRPAAFSDAGGSIRLNLDELTGAGNAQKLLSAGEKSRDK